MSILRRLAKLEGQNAGFTVALPQMTTIDDHNLVFRWNVNGKPHGDGITFERAVGETNDAFENRAADEFYDQTVEGFDRRTVAISWQARGL